MKLINFTRRLLGFVILAIIAVLAFPVLAIIGTLLAICLAVCVPFGYFAIVGLGLIELGEIRAKLEK